MLQTPYIHPVMDRNTCVDRQVSIRSLVVKKLLIANMEVNPRPDGDIDRSVSVTVSLIPTFCTLKDSTVASTFSTTPTTYLRGISRVNRSNQYIILSSDAFECHSERAVRHTFGLTVTLPMSLRFIEMFKVFDTDKSIILLSKFNDLMSDLVTSSLGIVSFIPFEFTEGTLCVPTSFISIPFKFRTSDTDIPLLMSNVLSKVKLPKYFTISINNRDSSETFNTNIDTDDSIIVIRNIKFLFEGNEDTIFTDTEEGSIISLIHHTNKSIISTIHSDWYDNSPIHTSERDDWITTFGNSEFTTSRDIEWDSNAPSRPAVIEYSDSIFEQFDDGLGVQTILLPDILVKLFMEGISTHTLFFSFYNVFESGFVSRDKIINHIGLDFGRFENINPNSFDYFHISNVNRSIGVFKGFSNSSPPCSFRAEDEVSLEEIR